MITYEICSKCGIEEISVHHPYDPRICPKCTALLLKGFKGTSGNTSKSKKEILDPEK